MTNSKLLRQILNLNVIVNLKNIKKLINKNLFEFNKIILNMVIKFQICSLTEIKNYHTIV